MSNDPYTNVESRERTRKFFLYILNSYYFPFASGKADAKQGRATGEEFLNRNSPEYRAKMDAVIANDIERLITLAVRFRFYEFPDLGGMYQREFCRRVKLQWPEDLYQEFSKFVAGNDQIRVDYFARLEAAHSQLVPDLPGDGPQPTTGPCPYCDGELVVMVPVASQRTGEIRNCAYRCTCHAAAAKYGGLPVAEQPMLDHARKQAGREKHDAAQYLKRIGVDPDRPLTFGDFFRQLKRHLGAGAIGTPGIRLNRPKTDLPDVASRPTPPPAPEPLADAGGDFRAFSDDASALAVFNEQIPGEPAWGDDDSGSMIF